MAFVSFFRNTHIPLALVDSSGMLVETNPALSGLLEEIAPNEMPLGLNSLFDAVDLRALENTPTAPLDLLCGLGELRLPVRASILPQEGRQERVLSLCDRSEIAQLQARLETITHYDALTGLLNGTSLQGRLQTAMDKASRSLVGPILIMLSLLKFREFNDSFGHDRGNALLLEAVERIQKCLPREATLVRLTGIKFGILLPNERSRSAVTHQVREIFRRIEAPFKYVGQEVYLQAKAGVGLYPEDGETPDELMKNVETALNWLKDPFGNRIQYYSSEISERIREQLFMESAMHRALERDEFMLHYQPQVDPFARHVTGAEALLRWNHPTRGLLPPAEFLPAMEEAGLMPATGRWAMRKICSQVKKWQADGHPRLRAAINVSAQQFGDTGFIDALGETIDECAIDPATVDIEISERLLAHQPQEFAKTLSALSSLGVRISIDDFGTGHSSLSHLKRLPVSALKIDRSFIQGIPYQKDDVAIASAILAIAKNLGLQVTAEGVETLDQLAYLHALRCHQIQGYLYGKPMSVEDFGPWLRNSGKGVKTYPVRP